ncbi:phosphatidylinositol phosphatase [Cavenderia fasciculata]|uniref:Phosphatidylinositol phosphatase n=1 Tax=Cavenderia fasciculata TaxID=261658 RepID=F4PZ15_CACFS|nr:phosphatidylinositol phosphatase [Cavenderia fasciculata]EGG19044.1 phosphatidylinositol phosphatase [Cavenderia fasciculata]|eukprot:XP_004366677.1 phosphatidylinositol phosphatase [Cavenderia fasciculata]
MQTSSTSGLTTVASAATAAASGGSGTAATASVVGTTATTTSSLLSYLNPFAYTSNTLFYTFSLIKFGFTFYMFYKGKLPVWFARYFGRLVHFATLPIIVTLQYVGLRGHLIDRVDDHVWIGSAPMPWDVPLLKQNRIEAVVNMCDEYYGPLSVYEKLGIRSIRFDVVDHYEPSVGEIASAIQFIEQAVQNNQNVLVHCKAGRGRSAAVLICWIAYSKNMSLDHAQKYLQDHRPRVRKTLYRQKNVLAFYSKYCCSSNARDSLNTDL